MFSVSVVCNPEVFQHLQQFLNKLCFFVYLSLRKRKIENLLRDGVFIIYVVKL